MENLSNITRKLKYFDPLILNYSAKVPETIFIEYSSFKYENLRYIGVNMRPKNVKYTCFLSQEKVVHVKCRRKKVCFKIRGYKRQSSGSINGKLNFSLSTNSKAINNYFLKVNWLSKIK